MRIALIAPTEIPARRANTIQVMKMASALIGLGHTVAVAAPCAANARSAVDTQEIRRQYGLNCEVPIDRLPAHPRLRRYDYSLRALRWAKGWQAQMIYTRLPQAAALAAQTGAACIYEVHDLPRGYTAPLYLNLFVRGRGARRLVLITRLLADDLHACYRTPIQPPFTIIAPDGVDLERFAELPKAPKARRMLAERIPSLKPEAFTVGYTGHLYPGRGCELLADLARRLPEIQFLIVGGEATHVERLHAHAHALGLDNFHLTGFVPNADLPLYQAACDALLAPYLQQVSASSGGDIARYLSPLKIFEYMASGRAIVCSDLPPLREALTPEQALLVAPGDAPSWEAALRLLQDDPALIERLGAAARRAAVGFSWEQRAARIFSFEG